MTVTTIRPELHEGTMVMTAAAGGLRNTSELNQPQILIEVEGNIVVGVWNPSQPSKSSCPIRFQKARG
jgi:hypothetical protein